GTERLRITPTPFHTDALIAGLQDALVETWDALDLPLEGAATSERVSRRTDIFFAAAGG
ncbi:5-aminolevulinate synthase, partial [Mesorhizobium sp. PL10]